ncbi:SDR family NAD(P)-dependent oxidoreductase [Egibacter rhizosphaerae]|uniref:SDR family NAD(P)-dependent oxidoreductase n=1 Tax=Egibacter rhizosphaerae TaxID=1670831 RepID=A0A411YDF4_9ACTN|nr:SDR family NAD(P)-dependent oxidoreductase [Egibacter rhizosphaerae]QBI19254.1 SDR family NAD(P)-dependent oxidoreductase [Egibacter rhizosphaerae]
MTEPPSRGTTAHELHGRHVLVTGGASGIGAELVRDLAARGARVTIADRDERGARAVAEEVAGRELILDVTDAAAWDRAAATIGPLDMACLNAGTASGTPDLEALDVATCERLLRTNIDGVVLGLRALLAHDALVEGAVVLVSASLAGLTPMPSDPLYAATKHATVGLVRSMAPGLADRGVRIQAVCPGIVDTPMLDGPARDRLQASGFPLIPIDDVVAGARAALRSDGTGEAWVVQAGRPPEPYAFRGVPGPRVPGAHGLTPPGVPGG